MSILVVAGGRYSSIDLPSALRVDSVMGAVQHTHGLSVLQNLLWVSKTAIGMDRYTAPLAAKRASVSSSTFSVRPRS
jgi:hypothetical protein